MNGDKKQARRYHWHSEELKSFVDEPHSAIDGPAQGEIVNLTDKRAEHSRAAQLKLLAGLGPDRIVSELSALSDEVPAQAMLPHLVMPAHHDVRSSDVFVRRLHGTLAAAAELGPVDFPELLLIPVVDDPISRNGCRGRAWSPLPLPGSRAVFVGAWREGSASLPGSP
jgi:uncharacterized protein